MFPLKEQKEHNLRNPEMFKVIFTRTEAYRKSAIPSIQIMLNQRHVDTLAAEAGREGGGHGRG